MAEDRERLRSQYAAALTAHFGRRALTIARQQREDATGAALDEWTALVELLESEAGDEA
ncbi:hypothetical protein [Sphingomonas panacisoli]|uniref:hypothetical protein n=1 Tax=Sphingomonas panacisoli TaxID=1813879 RepID=UPI001646AC52|nr:hypothetical protein [Sphingomonas panacisoli]